MALRDPLVVASLLAGGLTGLLVAGAASVAGRGRPAALFSAGALWGLAVAGLLLTDCRPALTARPLSDWAFPLYFAGLLLWPVLLARGRFSLGGWLGAQLLLLLTIALYYPLAVATALCTLT